MYILYMFVLNNTPFVHARVYLQYFNSALPGGLSFDNLLQTMLRPDKCAQPNEQCYGID